MKNFYRRAVRFSALSALCVALPAAAQVGMGRIAEVETSPFGTFPGAWSGALGDALKPSGPLNSYAYPLTDNGKPSYDETTAAAPDLAVLHRLAPVIVALKQSGVTPDEFKKLSPEEQAQKIQEILPESGKLVGAYAKRIVKSLDVVDSEAEDHPVDAELADLIKNYSAYADNMDQAGQNAFSAANVARFSQRDQRIVNRARDEAESLNHPSLPQDTDAQPAAAPISEPVRVDARLAEIKILSAQLSRGASARTDAAYRAFSLATTGEPNEAVQRAAIRILITTVEKGGNDPRYKRHWNVKTNLNWISSIRVIAVQSPYAGVQRLAVNDLLDNTVGELYRAAAVNEVRMIALATPSREIKEEAIALLLREIESSSSLDVKRSITSQVDAIKAGMASEPQIAKAPEKQALRNAWGKKLSAGGIVAGVIALVTGFAISHGETAGAAGAFFVLGGGFLLLFGAASLEALARALPWYRKD
jgi:hypothetical protein